MGDFSGGGGGFQPPLGHTPSGQGSAGSGITGNPLIDQIINMAMGGGGSDNTGAPAPAGTLHNAGKVGGFDVGQVDVRTPLMQSLEAALAPMLFTALLQPQKIAQMIGQSSGQVPGLTDWSTSNPAASMAANTSVANTSGQQAGMSALLGSLFGMGQPMAQVGMPGGGMPGGQGGMPGGAGGGLGALPGPGGQLPPGAGLPSGQGQPSAANPPPHLYTGQPVYQQQQPQQQPAAAAPQVATQPNPRLPGATAPSAPLPTALTSVLPQGTNVSYQPGYVGGPPQPGSGQLPESQAGGTYTLDFGGLPGGGLTGDALRQFEAALEANHGLAGMGLAGMPVQQQPLSFHAAGGPLDPNAINIVGEAGPEAIVGNQVTPLPTPPQLPNAGAFQPTTLQGPGTGSAMRSLEQNPEQEVFQGAQAILGGNAGGNAGQNAVNALQPVFQQNLQHSLTGLRNMSPSTFNTGIQGQGADVARTAMNDFNSTAAQLLLQGQGQNAQNQQVLGQLASNAGNGQFGRQLGLGQLAGNQLATLRGQDIQQQLALMQLAQQQQQFTSGFGLQQQQQQYAQTIAPTLQLLLAAMGMSQPTAYQTLVPGKA